MAESKGKKISRNSNLMIINEDLNFTKVMKDMFSKNYKVEAMTDAKTALEMLNKGYKPATIICSDDLSEIKMPEFIEKSKKYSPYSTKIILTDDRDKIEPQKLLKKKSINMIITKDTKGADFQQAVRIAFDLYHYQYQKLLHKKELKEKSEQVEDLKKKTQDIFPQSIQAMRGLINLNERFYFTDHINSVALIIKSIGEALDMDYNDIKDMIIASILFNSIVNSMPQRFIVNDPYDLDDDNLLVRYFELFNIGVNLFSNIEMFKTHARIISQVWERADGTGLPNGIPGEQLPRAPQIISLANYYHNMVYRVDSDKVDLLKAQGELKIEKATIKKRHERAIKTLYKNPKWYDYELLKIFHELIKRKNCIALMPDSNPNELRYFEIDSQQRLFEENDEASISDPVAKDTTEEDTLKGSDDFGKVDLSKDKKKKEVEKDIDVENLQPGMIVANNVVTKKGILIVRQDTRIDPSTAKNIKHLAASGMLSNYITITVED